MMDNESKSMDELIEENKKLQEQNDTNLYEYQQYAETLAKREQENKRLKEELNQKVTKYYSVDDYEKNKEIVQKVRECIENTTETGEVWVEIKEILGDKK